MYHKISDFLIDWQYESQATFSLMKNLKDESLDKKVHENVRSLGFLAWHIIHTMHEMLDRTGLKVDIKGQQDYNGESVDELCQWYEKGAKAVAEAIHVNWVDADLGKEDEMYGEMWKRGMTLAVIIRHQIHHRAEMIVVMRLLGLPIVGIYGPTKEEWAEMGQPGML